MAVCGDAVVEAFRFDAFYVCVGPLVVRNDVYGGVGSILQRFRVIKGSGLPS